MAKVYAELIRKGRKTIDDVPEHLVDEVRMLLGMVPRETAPVSLDGGGEAGVAADTGDTLYDTVFSLPGKNLAGAVGEAGWEEVG